MPSACTTAECAARGVGASPPASSSAHTPAARSHPHSCALSPCRPSPPKTTSRSPCSTPLQHARPPGEGCPGRASPAGGGSGAQRWPLPRNSAAAPSTLEAASEAERRTSVASSFALVTWPSTADARNSPVRIMMPPSPGGWPSFSSFCSLSRAAPS